MRRETKQIYNFLFDELNFLGDCVYKCWQCGDINDEENYNLMEFLKKMDEIIFRSDCHYAEQIGAHRKYS